MAANKRLKRWTTALKSETRAQHLVTIANAFASMDRHTLTSMGVPREFSWLNGVRSSMNLLIVSGSFQETAKLASYFPRWRHLSNPDPGILEATAARLKKFPGGDFGIPGLRLIASPAALEPIAAMINPDVIINADPRSGGEALRRVVRLLPTSPHTTRWIVDIPFLGEALFDRATAMRRQTFDRFGWAQFEGRG